MHEMQMVSDRQHPHGPVRRRQWTGREKLRIILQVMQGRGHISELCARHRISEKQYYQWRDRLLEEGARIFDFGGPGREGDRLKLEILQLKARVRELKAELNKDRELFW